MRNTRLVLASVGVVLPLLLAASAARAQTAAAPVAPSSPVNAGPAPLPAPPPPSSSASSASSASLAPSPIESPPAAGGASDTHLDVLTLNALRARNAISEAEYAAAVRDIESTTGQTIAADAPNLVLGKWSTTIYGFVKSDFSYDTTQSFGDLAGNTQVQRPNGHPLAAPANPTTYQGDNPRAQFSIRDTRFGLRMRAPETNGVRASAQLEFDFFGATPTTTEAAAFSAPNLRMRHGYFRIETPVVDVLIGQYWHLFGWQNVYHPGSVQAQGLAGQLYSRDAQIRISKTITTSAITLEAAVAALRPPQRDAGKPQGEAGLRLAVNKWTGVTTQGAAGTGTQPLSIAVTGNFRDITVPNMDLVPTDKVDKGMFSIAVDGYIPIIPATKERKNNALSVTGEFVSGNGIADLYTGLNGGLTFPHIPNTQGFNPAPIYPQNVDNGLVSFDINDGSLHAIQWTTVLAGLQYYLPFGNGRAFIAANYSHQQSNNIANYTQDFGTVAPDPNKLYYTSNTSVRKSLDLVDVNLFVDVLPQVRLGLEVANYWDKYVDGTTAKNMRVQFGGLYVF